MKFRLKVFRGCDACEGRYETFELEYEEGMTLLTALQRIKESQDPSLTFRQFCRAGVCGTCAVSVNGFPKLACKEQILPYAMMEREITVEPIDNFPLIKDLAVDHERELGKIRRLHLWIRGENVRIFPEINRKIEKAADCILCFACQSYCPQVLESDYAGPLFFAKFYRFLEDPRERNRDYRLEEAFEGNLYHCLSCDKCNSTCPREVEPATLIRELMTYIKEDG